MPRNSSATAHSKPFLRSLRLVMLTAGLLGLGYAAAVTFGAPGDRSRSESAAAIQDGLQRIVQIRRQQLERYQKLRRTSGTQYTLHDPTVELLRAEARLARHQGRDRVVQDRLGRIVALRQETYQQLSRSSAPNSSTQEARIRLHEAEYEFHEAAGKVAEAQRDLAQIAGLQKARFERIQRLRQPGQTESTAPETAELDYLESRIRLAEFELNAADDARQTGQAASGGPPVSKILQQPAPANGQPRRNPTPRNPTPRSQPAGNDVSPGESPQAPKANQSP